MRRREVARAAMMIAPALALVACIFAYPAVFTLTLSVSEFDMVRLKLGEFIALRNYADLFDSPGFVDAVFRTVYFGLLIALVTTILGFLIALLLDQPFRGRGFLRVVVILPWAVSAGCRRRPLGTDVPCRRGFRECDPDTAGAYRHLPDLAW